jgi:hypothetical protein
VKTQWPYSTLNHADLRRDARSLDERTHMRTRYRPAERPAMRAENHIDVSGGVRNSSLHRARAPATSLEVNRETGWRDNKLCRRTRDICSCLHFIGGYPATSNKRTNGLIRNNKGAAECGKWGR